MKSPAETLKHSVRGPFLYTASLHNFRDGILKDGQEQKAVVDLFDYYNETTGFTSMQRTTGWHAVIMARFMTVDKLHQGEFQSN